MVKIDDTLFIPLTTDEQVKNRVNETFEKANVECDLVLNLDLIIHLTQGLREHFELLRKVKTRIIIETVENESRVKKIIEKILPKSNDFEVKIIHKSESIPYYIIDNCELWFSMKKKTASGLPCILWTNSRNIVDFFLNCFNESWKSQNATTLQISKI